jgi:hypothetical protein
MVKTNFSKMFFSSSCFKLKPKEYCKEVYNIRETNLVKIVWLVVEYFQYSGRKHLPGGKRSRSLRYCLHYNKRYSRVFRAIPIFRHYSYIPSVDGNWGGLVDAVNNTFNGMIGMLQKKV